MNIHSEILNKGIPVLYKNKENCCGCFSCYATCPVQAIVMKPDKEGFLYPSIESEKCIRCFKCISVCAFKQNEGLKKKQSKPIAYAVKHIDEKVREVSRSGGVFTAISDEILSKNGVVYGCALSEQFEAIHIRAEIQDERNRMRGSKYVQSNIGNIYNQVAEDLKLGRLVMFSGTSCQVAALKTFLVKDYDNLICVDIACMGVPSPVVWKDNILWLESKYGKIERVDFRNKKDFGWRSHVETYVMESGKVINSKVFPTLFTKWLILRPSCHQCPYKDVMHPGDVTLADFWGIDKAVPEFDDNKGVSLLLINTDKGNEFINKVKSDLNIKESCIEHAMQRSFISSCEKPEERKKFWKDYNKYPFEIIARKWGGHGLLAQLITKGKNKKQRLVGKVKSICHMRRTNNAK